jgi:hypothetical protein
LFLLIGRSWPVGFSGPPTSNHTVMGMSCERTRYITTQPTIRFGSAHWEFTPQVWPWNRALTRSTPFLYWVTFFRHRGEQYESQVPKSGVSQGTRGSQGQGNVHMSKSTVKVSIGKQWHPIRLNSIVPLKRDTLCPCSMVLFSAFCRFALKTSKFLSGLTSVCGKLCA